MGVFQPGDHGSTFGGNPLACAVAREALQVLVDEKLIENSAELGAYFLDKLRAIRSPHDQARCAAAACGSASSCDAGGRRRAALTARRCRRKGLLCKETHVHTIRFAPPLCIRREELDWAFERIVEVFDELGRK